MALAGMDAERFASRDARYEHAAEFVAELESWTRSKPRGEIFHEAQLWRIPMGQVSLINELPQLEQLVERGFFQEVDHPVVGRRIYPSNHAHFNETPPGELQRAPLLGEHTAQILCDELGYTQDDLLALGRLGAI